MNLGMSTVMYSRTLRRLSQSPVLHCVNCRLQNPGTAQTSTKTSRTLCYKSSATAQSNANAMIVERRHSLGILQQPRRHLLGVSDNFASFLGYSKATDWNKAVTEAEKIVGYPTSFMSLRCLLSDEFSNVALHMRRLVGTKHPLLKTARRFVFEGTESLQIRGLLVLLVAKAAGPGVAAGGTASDEVPETMVSGIYPSQRNLAEITEMIHTAHLIHTGVVDVRATQPDRIPEQDDHNLQENIHFGNKLAVLSGDFLLANASTALARLYNTEVVELISSAIRDMTAAEFTTAACTKRFPDLPSGDATVEAWERQTFLSTGSLLAKSCKGVLMLARHDLERQEAGYQFGRSMGFAYQLHEDLRSIIKPESETSTVSMTSLPVALHLDNRLDDRDVIEDLVSSPSTKSQKRLETLLSTSGTIAHARSLVTAYQERALQAVGTLGENEARTAITNMVHAVTEV